MENTEEEILKLLSNEKSMSIFQISNSLNLTKADIRYHIRKLIRSGKVIKVDPERGLPGRPAFQYQTNDDYFSHNYVNLIEALLRLMPVEENGLNQMADFLLTNNREEKSNSLITLLNEIIKILNRQNYKARWETHYHGPIIYLANCPYRELVRNHPFLCKFDHILIEKGLNKKVNSIKTKNVNQSRECIFQVII